MGSGPLKIYATPLSANGRKVLAVSRHLGLNAEIHDVDVYRGEGRTPEYLAINPTGKIPTLAGGDHRGFFGRRNDNLLQGGGFPVCALSKNSAVACADRVVCSMARYTRAALGAMTALVGRTLGVTRLQLCGNLS